jgi:hypothetical protein
MRAVDHRPETLIDACGRPSAGDTDRCVRSSPRRVSRHELEVCSPDDLLYSARNQLAQLMVDKDRASSRMVGEGVGKRRMKQEDRLRLAASLACSLGQMEQCATHRRHLSTRTLSPLTTPGPTPLTTPGPDGAVRCPLADQMCACYISLSLERSVPSLMMTWQVLRAASTARAVGRGDRGRAHSLPLLLAHPLHAPRRPSRRGIRRILPHHTVHDRRRRDALRARVHGLSPRVCRRCDPRLGARGGHPPVERLRHAHAAALPATLPATLAQRRARGARGAPPQAARRQRQRRRRRRRVVVVVGGAATPCGRGGACSSLPR